MCLTPGVTRFTYEYDFGDSRQHLIQVESTMRADNSRSHPLCVAGANACPPEDVGSTSGYFEFMQTISDRSHPKHADMLRWCGGAFDPRGFDLNSVNAALRRLKIPPSSFASFTASALNRRINPMRNIRSSAHSVPFAHLSTL